MLAGSAGIKRIITLTPNPTLDAISEVVKGGLQQTIENQEVLRVPSFRYQVGGKGITCGRMLKVLGGDCLAVVLLGKDGLSRCIEHYLRCENLCTRVVRSNSLGRVCLILTEVESQNEDGEAVEATGVDYRINGGGSRIDLDVMNNLLDTLRRSLRGAGALALAGSLPEGVPDDFYAQCIRLARKLVPLVTLDSSGEPLRHGALAKPHLIKINAQEAAALMQEPCPETIEAAAGTAWRLINHFNKDNRQEGLIEKVIITLGAGGAAAVDTESGGQWSVEPPRVKSQGALGAGDSFSAGLVYALTSGKEFSEALKWGAACGAATAMMRPGEIGNRENIFRIYQNVLVVPLEVRTEAAATRVKVGV